MRQLEPYCSSSQSRKTFSACPRLLSKNLRALARSFFEPRDQPFQRPPLQTASHPEPSLCPHRETILGSTSPTSRQNPASYRTSVREPESPHCKQGPQLTCELGSRRSQAYCGRREPVPPLFLPFSPGLQFGRS